VVRCPNGHPLRLVNAKLETECSRCGWTKKEKFEVEETKPEKKTKKKEVDE